MTLAASSTVASKPAGAKPMQINCAWHSDGAVMRIKSNRVFG